MHRLSILRARIQSWRELRVDVIQPRVMTPKEHQDWHHVYDLIQRYGSIVRGCEESVERDVQKVKAQERISLSIVEPARRVKTVLEKCDRMSVW